MTAIDCTDCYLTIAIGDGVRRGLVRHFSAFIGRQLAERGAPASDSTADKSERDAWRLAARVLNEVEAEIEGALDETLLSSDPQKTVQDILTAAVESAAREAEQDYLDDALLGFPSLIESLAD